MIFERIVTEDLMHYSYFVADEGRAMVVDPRLDFGIYLTLAAKHQVRITGIFETHRNEDMLSGAAALGEVTGAPVFVSCHEDLPYEYGEKIGAGDSWALSPAIEVIPLHTPGHTLGHMSYALRVEEDPYLVFTGDCLFYGGVGRTDFYGSERLEEMTRLQHESIYQKLNALGSEVLVFPAHGAGSACGDNMEDRPFSTLGYELRHSEALAEELEEFLAKNAAMKYKNPAFSHMERKNLTRQGLESIALPYGNSDENAQILDIRPRESFQSQHLAGSIHIPAGRVSYYTGWFLSQEDPITVMAGDLDPQIVREAIYTLARQGYRYIQGILTEDALEELRVDGKGPAGIPWISGEEYRKLSKGKTLDVRRPEELEEDDPISDWIHIPMQELKDRVAELNGLEGEDLFILCHSGRRATVAASWLKAKTGLRPVIIEGGLQAVEAAAERDQ